MDSILLLLCCEFMMTKFLVDEDVNQKAVRIVDAEQKGFDILYPEQGSLKGAPDHFIQKRAIQEDRVLVTCDRHFVTFGLHPDQVRNGVLWIKPSPRRSQKRICDLLQRFCEFLQKTSADDPYNFKGKMFEISDNGVQVTTEDGKTSTFNF